MNRPKIPSRLLTRRRSLQRFGLCCVVYLSGCAQLPSDIATPQIKQANEYQSHLSFQSANASWPTEQWWRVYGDAQLNGLMTEAMDASPNLMAAMARVQRADAITQIADSSLKPQVNANASLSQDKLSTNYLTPKAVTPSGWNDYGRATVNLQWELDFWGKNRASLAAATSESQAGQAELAQARLMLTSGIATQYAELSRLHAIRDIAKRSVELHSQTSTLVKQRLSRGLETRAALWEADTHRAEAENAVLALDERIALQRNRLAALMGAGPDRGLSIEKPTLKLEHSFGLPVELAVNLLGRRPDVVAARLQAQAQASRIEQKKTEFYPNVNLNAFIGVQSLGIDMLNKDGSSIGSVGPAISLPLFTGGRLRGELRGAQARYGEAVANYNATIAHALQEVADAAVSQKALSQQSLKVQEAFEANSEAYRLTRQRYAAGLVNVVELLSAENRLLQSQTELTHMRSISFTLDIALKRALGGGFETAQR